MAQRRMFSPQIVESDEFLTMPVSSQALYFHLAMNADDDGFIQPKIIMRTTGANDDDLKVLLTKRFLLPFETGVVVIKHWLIHNLIQKDRYHPTRFIEEKKLLLIKENKAYTDNHNSVNKMLPEVRLGKDRLLSNAEPLQIVSEAGEEKPRAPKKYPHSKEVFSWFPHPQKSWNALKDIREREAAEYLYERGETAVRGALKFAYAHKNEDFFKYHPVWKPSQLEKNWVELTEYKPV